MANILGTQTVNGIWIVNTDTNPTLTGGIDAPIGSWGLAEDGSGFFYKFGASNTDWQQGTSTSDISGANVLLVRKNPTVGQYATIEDAINAVTSPSDTNRWLILVGVGQFTENTLVLPNYTSVVGASIQETQIFPATSTQHIFELGLYNEISFMWLEGAGAGYSAIHVNDSGNYSQAHKVTFTDNDINILVESATQDTFFYGEYLDFNGTYSYGLKVISTNGFEAFANVENYYNYPTGGTTIGNYITGTNANVDILAGGCLGINVGTAFYIENGASLQLTSFNINNFDKGIHNGNVGAACDILVSGVVAKDIVTYDIQIEHLTTSGTIGGIFDDTKISLASNLVGLLVQDTNDGSLLITNNLKVLFNDGTITDVSSLIIEGATMGVEKGGILSDGGGFVVDITAGNGYFEIIPDVDIIKRLDWNNTSITLSANVDVFIYFNNNGTLVSNGAQPDTRFNILLGRVVTNGTGIEFIDASPLKAEHTSNLILNNLREAIGSIYASGSIVTENATPLNLDVGSGEYYYGENEFIPSGGTGITFTSIYGQGSGVITGQTAVNNTQYDNAGTLTALTTGYYAKGSIYLVGDGVNEKYYFVFAQAEYSTLLAVQQADIPLPPNSFTGSVVLISGIIIQEGNPNIVQIVDQRPLIGFRAFGVTASADHLSLLNLNGGVNGDGGHTNMFTVNGAKAMTGNMDMGTNNIFNAGTFNSVVVEAHASRHLPNGLDPLTTAAPTTNLSGTSTNAVGIQNSFSRSDHSHAITGAALTRVNDTNVTLTLGGSPTSALLNSTSLTLGWTGTLSETRGGTNQSTYTEGDILYASAINTLSKLSIGSGGSFLRSSGTTVSWSTTTFPNAATAGDLIYASSLNNFDVLPVGTNGQVLKVVAGVPTWATDIIGTGTVTSFSSGDLSPLFTTSVATATTTPALSFALSNAAANTWFGNNTGVLGTPSYNSAGNLTKTDDTNVTLTLGGTPTGSLLNSTSLTLGWTGTLSVSRGGTNSSTALNNNRLMISSAGSIVEHSAQTVNEIAFYDANGLPSGSANFTWISASGLIAKGGSSNFININHVFKNSTGAATADVAIYGTGAMALGTTTAIGDKLAVNGKIRAFVSGVGAALQIDTGSITVNQTAPPTAFIDIAPSTLSNAQLRLRIGLTPLIPNDGEIWYDTSLKFYNGASTIDLSGTVIETRGGTNQTTYATGDILYASAANTLSKLGIGTVGQVLKVVAGVPSWQTDTATGTVTSVSVVTANGISGSVATATTTPAITLTLGAITPTTVNGNTFTTGTGTLTLSTFTLTVAGTSSISGTNTGDQTITLTGDVTGSGTGSFATTIGAGKVTNTMLVNSSITVNGTSISLGTSGTVTAAAGTLTGTTLNATVVSSSLTSVGTLTGGATGAGFTIALGTSTISGNLAEVNGGTNQTTYTTGDILYASAANTLSKLGIGTVGQVLKVVAGVPSWQTDTATGTVTSVSVVTNQGISGSVATATTTPAITLTLGALTGVTSFNGLVITANTGVITTGTWNGTAITNAFLANSSITVNGTSISLGASGTVTAAAGTLTGTTLNATVVSSSLTSVGTLTGGATGAGFTIALGTSTVTGTLAIGNGGTGQTTAILAFNALSPLTTKGDIITHNGTNNIRQAVGSNTQVLIADSSLASGIRWGDANSSIISPAAFAAAQNNYNPAGLADANVLRLTSTGAQNITGIVAPSTTKTIIIFNIGASNITLVNANAGSIAANRFEMNGNTILGANEGIILWYDVTTARWRAAGRAI